MFFLLVLSGAAGAALAGTMAWMMTLLLGQAAPDVRIGAVVVLFLGAHAVGALRVAERTVAERLGQHYANEIRTGLLASALLGTQRTSIGITIARTTNDVSSLRNWITMGLAPLAAGVPLLSGTAAALWLLSPVLALAAVGPLCILTFFLAWLAKPAFARSRILRKRRGRLAAQVADTVAASSAIRAAGGEMREIRRIQRMGLDVADAAVSRARVAGSIRGAAAVAASLTAVAVAAAGAFTGTDTATIAAALTVVGLISTPVTDLGRVVEYRQSYRAARRILVPALVVPQVEKGPAWVAKPGAGTVRFCLAGQGAPSESSGLLVLPGQRLLVRSSDPGCVDGFFEALLGIRAEPGAHAWIDGRHLASAPGRKRRELVGYAAGGAPLERGSIARAVRYRRPDLPGAVAAEALSAVGLGAVLERLPEGERTVLRHGGEPLGAAARGRLQIARAMLGQPPLLMLNRIDKDLDGDGTRMLAGLLEAYPGVVVIATDTPELRALCTVGWNLDDGAADGHETA
ncbi:ABC transporter transmembrane domain-containing protein [Arthrobacter silvisoli]|uniref:ABC transporter transmembrane domain-containing protein n=1 Tax=Arthrobacter silvisoli TaxID=2291022 RepID=UPI000E215414|nr:ABC transporter transmembrane domain-containing protein [Arthrobacter silvisoli]